MIELLRQFDLFEGLSDETLRPLAETGREVELATGELMIGSTDPVENFWLLLEGRIEFVRDGVVVSGAGGAELRRRLAPADRRPDRRGRPGDHADPRRPFQRHRVRGADRRASSCSCAAWRG